MKETSINLAIVGSKGSGKSALTVRFLTKRFIGEYDSQNDFCVSKNVKFMKTEAIVNLKDTTGSDWIKGPSALIAWTNGLVICYSISDRRSFELACYILETLNICKRIDPTCILLLANKSDLEHLRNVTFEEGQLLAERNGVNFKETSAAIQYEEVPHIFKTFIYDTIVSQINNNEKPHERSHSLIRRDSPINFSGLKTAKQSFRKSKSFDSNYKSPLRTYSNSSLPPRTCLSDDDKSNNELIISPFESTGQIGNTTKKRKISLSTFISKTVQPQKYFSQKQQNINRTK